MHNIKLILAVLISFVLFGTNANALRAGLEPNYSAINGYAAQFLCQTGELLNEDRFVTLVTQALYARTGTVNPQEVEAANKKEQDKQKTALVQKVFQADYNGDGKVSLDEVNKFEQIRQRDFDKLPRRSGGVKTDMDDPSIRVAQTMKSDTNKDGTIEYNELMMANGFSSASMMSSEAQKQVLAEQFAKQKEAFTKKQTDEARRIFTLVDINKDHVHSKEECQAYANWLGRQK